MAAGGISIHALREEGDDVFQIISAVDVAFLSTPSARRATQSRPACDNISLYFYPRPPRGGRQAPPPHDSEGNQFLSTPSARRATSSAWSAGRPARISIHALREEGDLLPVRGCGAAGRFLSTPSARRATAVADGACSKPPHFYPRPPRGGRRAAPARRTHTPPFLSTPSARRATGAAAMAAAVNSYFYPRPPRGGRLAAMLPPPPFFSISIHALREEGDNARTALPDRQADFYPRPPRGGRPCTACMDAVISCDFYPRPPRGGRLYKRSHVLSRRQFLSTPSARRATDVPCDALHFPGISIHALREEGDSVQVSTTRIFSLISIHALREEGDEPLKIAFVCAINFYPRPPRGGRPTQAARFIVVGGISIHALREEGDRSDHRCLTAPVQFLSTPSARRATLCSLFHCFAV